MFMTDNVTMINESIDSELLTEWEKEFITSVKIAIDEGRFLSDKQKKILVRIYTKTLNADQIMEAKEMAKKCMEKSDMITGWDSEFLDSICEVLEKGYMLTDKQLSSLKRIYSNVNKSGGYSGGGLRMREE